MKKVTMIILSGATTLLLSDLAKSQGAQPVGPTQWSAGQPLSQGPDFGPASQVDPSCPMVSYTAQNSYMGFLPNDTCGRCRDAWAGYCAERSAACARQACQGHGCGRCAPAATCEQPCGCGCGSCAGPCWRHAGCGLGVLRIFGYGCHRGRARACRCGDTCSAGSDAPGVDTDAEAADTLVAPEMTAPPSNGPATGK